MKLLHQMGWQAAHGVLLRARPHEGWCPTASSMLRKEKVSFYLSFFSFVATTEPENIFFFVRHDSWKGVPPSCARMLPSEQNETSLKLGMSVEADKLLAPV